MKLKQILFLFILLSLSCAPVLISCNKDDEIETVAQRNADKILSYGVDKANIIFQNNFYPNGRYSLIIEGEFLVIQEDESSSMFFPLEKVIEIEYDKRYNSLTIYFL